MDRRLSLHGELVDLAGSQFTIYYQPPEGTQIRYPCIIYERDSGDADYADNKVYRFTQRYQITVITRDADCPLPEAVLRHFRMCRMDRTFVSENLYHHSLILYY